MVLRTHLTGLQKQLVVSLIPNKITYTKEVMRHIQLITVHNVTRRKQSMPFNTYIDDRAMIPILLAHDWIIWKDTWTDCSYETYMALKKMMRHTGNAMPMV